MLVVTTKAVKRYDFHVPFTHKTRMSLASIAQYEGLAYILADGHELEAIVSSLHNIPHAYPTTIWKGDLALFVADNLPYTV